MNEDRVRELVRESIARHLGSRPEDAVRFRPLTLVAGDASHFQYALPGSGGPCLIEPAVACNHCGYCQSHGY
jgi:hypothetical protein